ncbi:MAG: carboxypeptidase regulatory-like domain-containing protein, partial [Chloroflexi bacterium]|nr:carboxypeptidase regulatory-like domain-containing protein [Chloroflexota bacterium]
MPPRSTPLRCALILCALLAPVVSLLALRSAAAATNAAALAGSVSDERFGLTFVNGAGYQVPDARYRQAVAAGARWTRWPMYWHLIETEPGKLDDAAFAAQDAVVNRDLAHGLAVNAILLGTAKWAATAGDPALYLSGFGPKQLGFRTLLSAQGFSATISVPRNLYEPVFLPDGRINPENYWARFVQAAATRYRGKVRVWEIWNEPDLRAGGAPVFFAGTHRDYVQLLRVAYLVIKRADPQAQVAFAGLAYWTDTTFLPRALDTIVADPSAQANSFYFDILPLHFYTDPNHLYTFPLWARGELAKRGLTKPIWVNETNLPVCDDRRVDPQLSCPSLYKGTMAEQAGFIIKAYALSLAAGVERVFVHQFYDDDVGPHEWYGLVRNAGTPRPAYGAYQVAATYLSWATRADRDWFGRTDGVVVRGTPRGKVTVLWARGTRNDVAKVVAASPSAVLVDRNGVERTVTPHDGVYLVPVPGGQPENGGGDPVLLIEPVFPAVVSSMEPLPAETPSATFPVRWSAVDGASPDVRFDVDVRAGSQGRWTRWLTNTAVTTAIFGPGSPVPLQAGETYFFRVRARVPSGDAEPYRADPGDTWTSVTAVGALPSPYSVAGRVLDHRDRPVPGATVWAVGSGAQAQSRADGSYTLALPSPGTYRVVAERAGFGALPPKAIAVTGPTPYDFFLPPAGDAVRNGGFEGGLAEWQALGKVAALSFRHTGELGAVLTGTA